MIAPLENKYRIKLPAFEGPLDLLLHLIRENKIDIYDIPISVITRQYLEYIEIMKELNLEIASEFVVMAATLIYIKSRMLLPVDEEIEQTEDEDPRASLVNRLLEYQAFKEASQKMREREELWADIFGRDHDNGSGMSAPEPELRLFDLNIFDMLSALKRIISRAPMETIPITRETLTVKDKIALLIERLQDESSLRFEDLFDSDRSRRQIIVTFLAILEVLRLGLARVYQEGFLGVLWIIRQEEVLE